MSTRSVIAKPTEDGWVGRYCHSDGYPEHQVPELMRLVKEKGLDRCIDILINFNAGWSYLTSDPTLTEGFNDDGRFKTVSNYGIAYTTKIIPMPGQPNYQQARMEDWIVNTDTDTWCEWTYVLTPECIEVYENTVDGWTLYDTVSYDTSYRVPLNV
jgi:hypothetical protein